jgi:UDP-2-acetamido-2,6-beta-L-arabino-hexul-4-ose reductase
MRILITGANGFLGKNLQQHLLERKNLKILTFTSDDNLATLPLILKKVDFIFHLAGVNRSETSSNFFSDKPVSTCTSLLYL